MVTLITPGFSLQTDIPRGYTVHAVIHHPLHDLQTAHDQHPEGVSEHVSM